MSTYKLRASDQSKTVLVNPLGYSSTLEVSHKFKPDTSVNQDMVRIAVASALQEHIDTCSKSCGDVRREVVSLSMAVLLGQEEDYYARKKQMLQDVITAANLLLDGWADVKIGIIPDFTTVTATVVPKVKTPAA